MAFQRGDRSTLNVAPRAAVVYGLPLAAVVAATAARWLFDPILGDHLPFVTFFVAVAVGAWAGGLRPALLATALGFVLSLYFFVPPRFSFAIANGPHLFGLLMFFMVSLAFAGFGEALHISRRSAHRQREQLHTTLASIGDAVIATDIEGRVTNLNAVAESLTGWSNADAVGQPLERVFRIVHEETRQPVENPATKALRAGVIVGLANHTILIAKDGTERPIDDSAAPIRDAEGNVRGVVLVFRDVTQRRETELALRTSEARKTAMFQSALDCIISIDHKGKVIEWNAAAETTVGYRREDVLGRELAGLIIPPAQRERHREGLERYLITGHGPVLNQRLELTAIRSDGKEFPVELAVTRIPGEGPPTFTAYVRDITERKQNENMVERAREYAEATLRTSPVPLLVLESDLRVVTANDAFYQRFQVKPEETEGRLVYELGNHQWDIPKLRDLLEGILSHQTWFEQFEVDHEFESIGRRTMLLNARRMEVEEGGAERIILVIEDITQRREAELANAFRASIVDSSDDAIVTKSLDGLITSWNAGAERLFGYTAAEAVGRPITMLIPPDRQDEEPKIIEQLGRGEPVHHFETQRVRKDGTLVDISLTVSPVKDSDGRVIGASKVARDITASKRVEDALRQSEERFRMLADNMAQLAWTCDVLGNVTWYNRRWLEYTGMSFEEMKGWDWSKVQHPDHLERVVERVKHSAETGEEWRDTFPLRGRDGRYRWFLSRAVPIRDTAGSIVCWFGTNTDVTEQLEAEEALREADRRKSEFLAMLAHELRNPLAPITNALQVLRMTGGDGEAAETATGIMERQVSQMVRLIDDLLDVSRISRGKVELKKGDVELASVVNQSVEAARPLYESMKHELTVTLPEEPIYLNADPARLAQIVGNLLNNAAKYTERGGRVWLTVERQGGEAVIAVKDSGIGISAEQLPHIFEMFTQVDTSLERTQSGLGIGLTLVKRLVELHAGAIEVRSDGLGQGSEFIVRLPTLKEAPQMQPPPSVREPKTPAGRRILIVDDNQAAAQMLATLLRLKGNQTHTVFDGLAAVEAAEANQPELMLLDIGLPKLNGYEACRRIREQPWGKDIVVVALTGWGQEEDRQKSQEAGFDGHLVKPVDFSALEKLLNELQPVAM